METHEQYDAIFDTLLNGTEADWERLARRHPAFPDGCDDLVGRRWIINAIDSGSPRCVRWMIDSGVNLRFVDDEGRSPLHCCIERELPGKYELLRLLIASGADINVGTELGAMAFNSWSPLHLAAACNDLEAIKILMDSGADATLKTIIDNYCTAEQEALLLGSREAAALLKNYASLPRSAGRLN